MLYVPSATNMTAVERQPGGERSDMNFIGGGGGGGGGRGAAPAAGRGGAPTGTDPEQAVAARGAGPAAAAGGGGRSRARHSLPVPGRAAVRGDGSARPSSAGSRRTAESTAYNMNTGDIVRQVANGDTDEWIKTHPA